MQGLIDAEKIEWYDPEFVVTPKVNVLNYNKDTTKFNAFWKEGVDKETSADKA
jgi:hypothetical protein